MTYEEAREFINTNKHWCVPGLETITELLNRLGNPQDRLKIVHVAGTNGKGSVCAFISAILTAAGYRVGRYVSPAVFSYEERIQISEPINRNDTNKEDLSKYHEVISENEQGDFSIGIEYITKKGVCDAIERIKPACESMVKDGYSHPTWFEIETAMTFLYLKSEQVDFVVLEVGLGGRLDATNVIRNPVCSVITSISMDHMQILGDTLEKIASEKAGIIKKDRPVITCEQEPEVAYVLKQTADRMKAPLTAADSSAVKDIRYSLEGTRFSVIWDQTVRSYNIHLLGEYQVKNAFLSLTVIKVMQNLGYPIHDEAVQKGLSLTKWGGRFEIVRKNPYFVIDGAHNEGAALTLRKSIEIYFTNRKRIFIMGVLADKDYKSILQIMGPLADTMITLKPDNSRALASSDLAKEAGYYCGRVIDAGNVRQALKLAYAQAGENDVIIAFGSFYYLGDLSVTLNARKDEDE